LKWVADNIVLEMRLSEDDVAKIDVSEVTVQEMDVGERGGAECASGEGCIGYGDILPAQIRHEAVMGLQIPHTQLGQLSVVTVEPSLASV
jgi:hypothetical protein